MSSRNVAVRFKIAALVLTLAGLLVFSDTRVGHAEETEHSTTSPIKHLVIIFQENVSFDHYFGTRALAGSSWIRPRGKSSVPTKTAAVTATRERTVDRATLRSIRA